MKRVNRGGLDWNGGKHTISNEKQLQKSNQELVDNHIKWAVIIGQGCVYVCMCGRGSRLFFLATKEYEQRLLIIIMRECTYI